VINAITTVQFTVYRRAEFKQSTVLT